MKAIIGSRMCFNVFKRVENDPKRWNIRNFSNVNRNSNTYHSYHLPQHFILMNNFNFLMILMYDQRTNSTSMFLKISKCVWENYNLF